MLEAYALLLIAAIGLGLAAHKLFEGGGDD